MPCALCLKPSPWGQLKAGSSLRAVRLGSDSLLTINYAVEESAENAYDRMDFSSHEGGLGSICCPFEVQGIAM